jgi:hypothetical protein
MILGLALGLVYAWVFSPVQFVDNSPSSLQPAFKDQYRAMIAVAYASNGDLGRAQARLGLLGDLDSYRALSAQAQQYLAEGGSPDEARALGELAAAFNQAAAAGPTPAAPQSSVTSTLPDPISSPMPGTTPSPGTGLASSLTLTVTSANTQTPAATTRSTRTPTPTRTPLPSRTPTATPGLPFVLQTSNQVCDPDLEQPLIQVVTYDVDGNQIPGIALVVSSPDGEEQFFTGLKPEIGLGYADYVMTPGIIYSLRIPDGGETVSGLTAEECETSLGDRYWGSWLVTFAQP